MFWVGLVYSHFRDTVYLIPLSAQDSANRFVDTVYVITFVQNFEVPSNFYDNKLFFKLNEKVVKNVTEGPKQLIFIQCTWPSAQMFSYLTCSIDQAWERKINLEFIAGRDHY